MTPPKNPTRSFLITHPRPVKVRLVLPSGEARTLDMGASPQWKRLAETIDALSPTTIEALDASGALLRARNPELQAEAEAEAEEGGDPDDPTVAVAGDGSLETFARLLADAHRSSGERAFQFVETAFARMVDIVNAQTKRMDSMERVVDGMHRVWRRAFESSLEQSDEDTPAQGQGALLQQMLGAFLASQAQGMAAGAAAPKPNGGANGVHTKGGT